MLRACRTFLFDADGTLWNSGILIRGAMELCEYLKRSGRSFLLVTNNSTKSVETYLDMCEKLGIPLLPSQVVCTANVTADFLVKKGVKGPVYVIGQTGIGEELDKVGIEHFGIGPEPLACSDFQSNHLRSDVTGVIVGFDPFFNYTKLMKAVNYIIQGAEYFATNEDALLPGANFSIPGTGAAVAAITKASGIQPIVIGKPAKPIWDFIKHRYGAQNTTTVIVGDRLDTDIQMGKQAKLHTVCVMSGVTSDALLADVRSDPAKESLLGPEYVFPTIYELYEQLLEEDNNQIGQN